MKHFLLLQHNFKISFESPRVAQASKVQIE